MSIEIVRDDEVAGSSEILTDEALAFVEQLHHRFDARRRDLLAARHERRERIAAGEPLDFLPETVDVRAADWRVPPPPEALVDRRVEITGPAMPAKMAINALNSGARVWLADLEDASSPTWANVVGSVRNLRDAARGTLAYTSPEGKAYALRTDLRRPTVVTRPRGWHLPEKHVLVDGERGSASLVDFGLHFFHTAHQLIDNGDGPFYYLPKLESHLEARLWNDVFVFAQATLGIPRGTVRATVLIETITAAFEMDEILYELREHMSGLNAGRWDYLFSIIKVFRDAGPEFIVPDRASVSMTAPFMRAYTELLVKTCHRRGAVAMGGMAAFVPNRADPEATAVAFEKVRADKTREANDGFDGSWVAHPDLVPVCREVFDVGTRRPGEPARAATPRGRGHRRAAARHRRGRRRGHRGGPAHQPVGGSGVHGGLARRQRRGRTAQPHGRRRHRRDLAVAGVAAPAARCRARRHRSHHDARARAGGLRRRARAPARRHSA